MYDDRQPARFVLDLVPRQDAGGDEVRFSARAPGLPADHLPPAAKLRFLKALVAMAAQLAQAPEDAPGGVQAFTGAQLDSLPRVPA